MSLVAAIAAGVFPSVGWYGGAVTAGLLAVVFGVHEAVGEALTAVLSRGRM